MSLTRIQSAGKDVVFTTSFITYSGEDSELFFKFNGIDLSLICRFETTAESIPSTDLVPVDPTKATLTFKNFTSPLGTAPTDPIELGEWAGKKLFLRYVIYHVGTIAARLVNLTAYTD